MKDRHNRTIRYLRLSLTQACQMRCAYCRPDWLGNGDSRGDLTAIEIQQLARHMVDRHGVSKIRLTGGDPTARKDLVQIIRHIAGIDGVEDLAMTTNGLSLAAHAQDYAAAGLNRINVSLDALDRQIFEQITGVDGVQLVLQGLNAARVAGLWPIKLNTVVMKGANEHQLEPLMRFAVAHDMEIRFIELMPMGPLAAQWSERYIPEDEMRQRLSPHVSHWEPLRQGSDSARRFRVELSDGQTGIVGFITPMSCNFCAACSRIRITSDGAIYPCLMDRPAGSLLSAFRPQFDGERLEKLLQTALERKREEHPVTGFVTMTTIGG